MKFFVLEIFPINKGLLTHILLNMNILIFHSILNAQYVSTRKVCKAKIEHNTWQYVAMCRLDDSHLSSEVSAVKNAAVFLIARGRRIQQTSRGKD